MHPRARFGTTTLLLVLWCEAVVVRGASTSSWIHSTTALHLQEQNTASLEGDPKNRAPLSTSPSDGSSKTHQFPDSHRHKPRTHVSRGSYQHDFYDMRKASRATRDTILRNQPLERHLSDQETTHSQDHLLDQEATHSQDHLLGQETTQSQDHLLDQETTQSQDHLLGQETTQSQDHLLGQETTQSQDHLLGQETTQSQDHLLGQETTQSQDHLLGQKTTHLQQLNPLRALITPLVLRQQKKNTSLDPQSPSQPVSSSLFQTLFITVPVPNTPELMSYLRGSLENVGIPISSLVRYNQQENSGRNFFQDGNVGNVAPRQPQPLPTKTEAIHSRPHFPQITFNVGPGTSLNVSFRDLLVSLHPSPRPSQPPLLPSSQPSQPPLLPSSQPSQPPPYPSSQPSQLVPSSSHQPIQPFRSLTMAQEKDLIPRIGLFPNFIDQTHMTRVLTNDTHNIIIFPTSTPPPRPLDAPETSVPQTLPPPFVLTSATPRPLIDEFLSEHTTLKPQIPSSQMPISFLPTLNQTFPIPDDSFQLTTPLSPVPSTLPTPGFIDVRISIKAPFINCPGMCQLRDPETNNCLDDFVCKMIRDVLVK